ncbi:hypothetical protein SAMN04244553_3447 [Nocardia amikacinitolerans]|uniref:Ribbon-helix-helix protein, copG family n=2 Tax=Nocardia amikacinitolerans TaxID=756689 RepID=A0A285LDN4_9NOCA|nr:hypothetical protein [Nocardia amikacinitolerans]MCP2292829.1 hypothetical protein [Nocardia amikacinitolerans]MCP2297426.1 hypothetical protein [Nocardia amikacinitolerans]MCP2318769.1 hypothetical protein [Nocardia amikacinitolerans]SNY82583.1 hypothetical protein SAMN04244553_3447 [Nocardia amikacinitolerans]
MHEGMSKATRITVTLDPQVAEWAKQAAERQNRSLSSLINSSLRTALVHESLTSLPVDDEADRAAAQDELDLTESAAADARRRSRGAA